MMLGRIFGAASQGGNQGAQAGAQATAGQQAGGIVGQVAGQAGATAKEEVSSKAGKANVALGAAGLFTVGLTIAGMAVPAMIANKAKNTAVKKIANPIATAVGDWVMDGTSNLSRKMPAVGGRSRKKSNANEYGLEL